MTGRSWSHIALDFRGLPLSLGNNVILTILGHFSNAAYFMALPKPLMTLEAAQLLIDYVFCLHGILLDALSDQGP